MQLIVKGNKKTINNNLISPLYFDANFFSFIVFVSLINHSNSFKKGIDGCAPFRVTEIAADLLPK